MAMAQKEGVLPHGKWRNYIMFCARKDSCVVGIAGILFFRHSAIMKTDYVIPEYRNMGIHMRLLRYRMEYCRSLGTKIMRAHCTKLSLNNYLACGFRKVRTFRNGITEVIYEDL
jgi:GNAT superfamily N-acetyltransferase